jgi:hypothetical protein
MYHTLAADSPLAERTLAELGVPAWDVVGARAGERHVYYEFAGDRRELLGSLLREESPA